MILFSAHPVVCYNAAGNAAFTVSTAALSFTSMERMLLSMAAVKTTAKREDLFMAVSFQALRVVFETLFHELDAGTCGNLSGTRKSSGKNAGRCGIRLKKTKSRVFLFKINVQNTTAFLFC